MKGDVQTLAIQNGLHDLVLSAPTVRTEVYQQLFQWLDQRSTDIIKELHMCLEVPFSTVLHHFRTT